MRTVAGFVLGVTVLVSGCALIHDGHRPEGVERGGWVWPTVEPLPDGATPVLLDVEPIPAVVQPGVEYGACRTALLTPVTIHHVPDDQARPIHYRLVDGGGELGLRWQPGFSARLAPDLEIVAPDGTVIAREGVPVVGLGGGVAGDDAFSVCIGDYIPQRVGSGRP
ncbi:MAG: hypothetical protein ACTS8Z_07550 [Candidatus Limnocylindrales bacterium]